MGIRGIKRSVESGGLALGDAGTVPQQKRLREAVTAARMYLSGTNTAEMGRALGRTPERAAQMVRLGISCLTESGDLRAVEESTSTPNPSLP